MSGEGDNRGTMLSCIDNLTSEPTRCIVAMYNCSVHVSCYIILYSWYVRYSIHYEYEASVTESGGYLFIILYMHVITVYVS